MEQIDKNNVDSKNQLKVSEYVSFFGNPEAKLRILFVGNSITRHAPLPEIGWETDCGMAASDRAHDYVHLLADRILEKTEAAFCICQVAEWERQFLNGPDTFSMFQNACDFCADIIIMRCIENSRVRVGEEASFRQQYLALVDFLNQKKTDKVILTSSFWHHSADAQILTASKERCYPYVKINDLGEMDEMKAIGKYAHTGVANHPGDKGMQTIAARIWEVLEEILNK